MKQRDDTSSPEVQCQPRSTATSAMSDNTQPSLLTLQLSNGLPALSIEAICAFTPFSMTHVLMIPPLPSRYSRVRATCSQGLRSSRLLSPPWSYSAEVLLRLRNAAAKEEIPDFPKILSSWLQEGDMVGWESYQPCGAPL
ncbi:hypothetical protein D9757_004769 [Collybiopsis confluens]|uniref:Uncharacterized protein n=1 Tax=Collybiopsis confluens TaxID=2823264 RepID=A0A8H5HSL7_9AGAR|nr:hypothetical protein D9757_004769 [Collybiopsis confluens]